MTCTTPDHDEEVDAALDEIEACVQKRVNLGACPRCITTHLFNECLAQMAAYGGFTEAHELLAVGRDYLNALEREQGIMPDGDWSEDARVLH